MKFSNIYISSFVSQKFYILIKKDFIIKLISFSFLKLS